MDPTESTAGVADEENPPPSLSPGALTRRHDDHLPPPITTRMEIRNLVLQVFCYACVMASTFMVVGTASPVVLSVGGSNQMTPLPIGFFFLGSSFISLLTPRFFRSGRKFGFLISNIIGLVGAGIGAWAVWMKSPVLMLAADFPLGMSFGIGNYLRFAAVEVVSPTKKSFAVTLVLTGGVLAAFIGPESAQATKTLFGNDMEYLGMFVVIAIFNIIMIVLQVLVQYPQATKMHIAVDNATTAHTSLNSLLLTRQFIIPVLIASFSWSIMAMPMSTVRLAMGQLGYTSRQSLMTIEFHFFGKFAPGFVTGMIIERRGALFTTKLSVGFFAVATVFSLVSDEHSTVATWMLGLFLIGVGWNLGFSSSTVMLTEAYSRVPDRKSHVQAANDFIMMLAAGATIVSTGCIYEAGGGGLAGWKAVNFVTLGFITLMCAVVVLQVVHEHTTTLTFAKGDAEVPDESAS